MLPTRQEAERLLMEAEKRNPGPWSAHSMRVAACAERIARRCDGMDADKAYVCGLLHDIGRHFGTRHLGHVYDGWKHMQRLGYDEVARVCLTHSFATQCMRNYIGNRDVEQAEEAELVNALLAMRYDDYDRLIQLCDSIASADGVTTIEDRMGDVKRRYGYYPQEQWDRNLELFHYFEVKMNRSIYDVVGQGV